MFPYGSMGGKGSSRYRDRHRASEALTLPEVLFWPGVATKVLHPTEKGCAGARNPRVPSWQVFPETGTDLGCINNHKRKDKRWQCR